VKLTPVFHRTSKTGYGLTVGPVNEADGIATGVQICPGVS